MQTIEPKILTILADYSTLSINELQPTLELEEIGIDSLSLVEIIFDIEEMFDIKIPDEQTLQEKSLSLTTVHDISILVHYIINESSNHD